MSETIELRPVAPRRTFASARVIIALILREMSTSYGRSPGGYIWAILEPLAGIALLATIFSLGFRSPPIGHNFAIFYATGLVPFLAYMDISSKTALSIQYSRQLLDYPAVTFVDPIFGRFILNGMTHMMVGLLLLSGIVALVDTRTTLELVPITVAIAMGLSFSFAVGVLNCFLFTWYPIWRRIWAIFNRPLLFASGVIFILDDIPRPYSDWLWWNPLIHIVAQFRTAFYPSYEAAYVSPTFVFIVSFIVSLIGLLLLRRFYRDMLIR